MSTDLISYLLQDKEATFAEEKAALVQEKAALVQAMQQAVEDVIIARFPNVPAALTRRIRVVSGPAQLMALHQAVLSATDLTAVAQALAVSMPPS